MYRTLIACLVCKEEEGHITVLNTITAYSSGAASPHKEALKDSTTPKAKVCVQNLILKQQIEVTHWSRSIDAYFAVVKRRAVHVGPITECTH